MTAIEGSRPAGGTAAAGTPGAPAPRLRPAPVRPALVRPALVPARAGAARLVRRGRLVALAVGCFLLPWCALLFVTLPATAHAGHWSLAWTGLDAAEAAAALATAVLLTRSDPRASLTAAAGGAFLLADAWFDVCTSAPGSIAPGRGRGGIRRASAGRGRVLARREAHPECPVKAALLGAAAARARRRPTAGAVLRDRAPYPYSLHRLLDIPLPLLTAAPPGLAAGAARWPASTRDRPGHRPPVAARGTATGRRGHACRGRRPAGDARRT